MSHKPFKETKLGKFLSDKVPGVLDVVDDYFPPAKILTALVGKNLPPEDQLEFEKLLNEHEKEMYSLQVQDRDSARHRESDFVKATGHIDRFMMVIGGFVLLAFSFCMYVTVFVELPETSREMFIEIRATTRDILLSISAYYWGSSAGSRIKDMAKKSG